MKTILQLTAVLLFFFVSADARAADDTYQRALKLFKDRNYKKVVLLLEKYIAGRPDAAAYYILGYSNYELRDFQKAREYFDSAYLLDPDFTYDRIFTHYDPSDEEQALIHEVLELSGTRGQIAGYAEVVGSGLPRLQKDQTDQSARKELLGLIRDAYRTETTYPEVVSIFRYRFQKDHLTAVLSWLKGPVGRKMTLCEAELNGPGGTDRIEAFGSAYQQLGDERRKIVARLEQAVGAAEMNVGVVSVSLLEMLTAMQSQVSGKNRMSSEEIYSRVEKVRAMPAEQLMGNVMLSLAYTFRDFTDAELEEIIRFHDTPAGRWFADTRRRAITFALGKASMHVGEQIGKTLMMKRIPI